MSQSIETVEKLIAAWSTLDAKAVADCFAKDGVWHNMPYAPLEGHEKISAAVSGFLATTEVCRFEVRHIAEIAPGVVVTERVDIFQDKSGKELRLPVMGVFEVSGGLIQVWRDYFDSAPYTAA